MDTIKNFVINKDLMMEALINNEYPMINGERIAVPTIEYIGHLNKMEHGKAELIRNQFIKIFDEIESINLVEEMKSLFYETAKLVESFEINPVEKTVEKIHGAMSIAMVVSRGMSLMLNAILRSNPEVQKGKLKRLFEFHDTVLTIVDMIMSTTVSSSMLSSMTSHLDDEDHYEDDEDHYEDDEDHYEDDEDHYEDDEETKPKPKPKLEIDIDVILEAVRKVGGSIIEGPGKMVTIRLTKHAFHRLVAVDRFSVDGITVSGNNLGELALEDENHQIRVVISDDLVIIVIKRS